MVNFLTGATGMGSTVIMLLLMVVVFYFMLIRPENKRKKAAEEATAADAPAPVKKPRARKPKAEVTE